MYTYPQRVFTAAAVPVRSMGTLPTGAPGVLTDPTLAHGLVNETGIVSIGVSAACTVEIYLFSSVMGWVHPSSGSAGYSKTFTEAAFDYFVGSPGDRFYIKSTVGVTGYTDGVKLGGVNHG